MIISFIYSWFRMVSGAVSEAVLVNLADTRYFQHGGNLMVRNYFLEKYKLNFYFIFRLIIQPVTIVEHIFVKLVISSVQLLVIVYIYEK
jgi:hypothetical protein